MGRERSNASLHSFTSRTPEPSVARIPFETLVREMLEQLARIRTRRARGDGLRVEASLKWLTRGYQDDVQTDRRRHLPEKHESMICVRDIEIYSMCEHHMLPFYGKAHVAYLPDGRIVASPRSHALSRSTPGGCRCRSASPDQVADALWRRAQAPGLGVVIEAIPPLHDDARRREAELEDGHERLRGAFRERRQDRDEFLRSCTAATACRDGPPPGARRKLALVTGASRGIGLAVAEELRAAGAHVVRLARSLQDASGDPPHRPASRRDPPPDVERVVRRPGR